MAGNYVIIERDAENLQLAIRVLDANGTEVAAYGSIKLVLGQDPGTTPANPGTTMGQEIKLRETKGCDANGNPAYCLMLRSAWYSTPKTNNPKT